MPNNKDESVNRLTPAYFSGSLQVRVGRYKKMLLNNEPIVRVPIDVAEEMIKERGYLDIDHEDVWEEWILYKKYVK